jgi:hypothetical protein
MALSGSALIRIYELLVGSRVLTTHPTIVLAAPAVLNLEFCLEAGDVGIVGMSTKGLREGKELGLGRSRDQEKVLPIQHALLTSHPTESLFQPEPLLPSCSQPCPHITLRCKFLPELHNHVNDLTPNIYHACLESHMPLITASVSESLLHEVHSGVDTTLNIKHDAYSSEQSSVNIPPMKVCSVKPLDSLYGCDDRVGKFLRLLYQSVPPDAIVILNTLYNSRHGDTVIERMMDVIEKHIQINTLSSNKIHHSSSAPQTTPFVAAAGDISHILSRVNNVYEFVMSIREIHEWFVHSVSECSVEFVDALILTMKLEWHTHTSRLGGSWYPPNLECFIPSGCKDVTLNSDDHYDPPTFDSLDCNPENKWDNLSEELDFIIPLENSGLLEDGKFDVSPENPDPSNVGLISSQILRHDSKVDIVLSGGGFVTKNSENSESKNLKKFTKNPLIDSSVQMIPKYQQTWFLSGRLPSNCPDPPDRAHVSSSLVPSFSYQGVLTTLDTAPKHSFRIEPPKAISR